MTKKKAKEVLAELDATLAEVESETPATKSQDLSKSNDGYNATDLALTMANDFNVDLANITGTGKNGKITVPDVDKVVKAQEAEKAGEPVEVDKEAAEVEATKAPDKATGDDKPAKKPTKPRKKRAKAGRPSVPFASALPLHTSYSEVVHVKRTLNEFGFPWNEGEVVTKIEADENLSKLLQKGFVPIHIEGLGVTPEGIQVLWVFGKPEDDETPRYNEIYHRVENVGGMGPDGKGLSGFRANAMVTSQLEAGWDLAYVGAVSTSPAGVNIMWVFVR